MWASALTKRALYRGSCGGSSKKMYMNNSNVQEQTATLIKTPYRFFLRTERPQ